MRKRLFILLLSVWAISVQAVTRDTLSSGFGQPQYALEVWGEYAYNTTFHSIGNLGIKGQIPLHQYVEMQAGLQLSTANIYTGTLLLRPKYAVPVGEIFLDAELLYKSIVRDNQWELATAISCGYRMDYLSVQVGWTGSMMNFYGADKSDGNENFEPYNMLYRIAVYCRPQSCNWNIMACAASYDDWQIERLTEPLFTLSGRYDVDVHWRIGAEVQLKPTGMFHLNATLYGVMARAGFTYRF